ncbi:hypothetical protein Bpfe_015925 [Biomphalaria pfeifferi]|uniref:Uncharacterized protein n=1 Tax=Biomphalaria pfeifferi TaxID=112525 RepID=A0AAD8BHC7_BIOPF|nr:hypothetical protein Bpfe_015925 [Biomphalaria pfeifferi]
MFHFQVPYNDCLIKPEPFPGSSNVTRDINCLVAKNINLIIVDLGVRYCFTNFLKEIPQNTSNYIRIVGDVESQEYLKERLTKLICQAINDNRYGCVPTVQ